MKTITERYRLTPYSSRTFDMYFGGRSLCIFDIETTGLYPRRDQLILSGLISIDNNLATVTQYFAEDPSQEKAVVDATLKQLALSDVIITYNGRSFDLPFLQARAKRYRLPAPASFCDLDLYTVLRYHSDLKDMLGSLRQKSIEKFMDLATTRDDEIDGGESVRLYNRYLESPNTALEKTILLHNHDDIMQLYRILPVIEKSRFHRAMACLGFPAGQSFVQRCQVKKDGLHIAARLPQPVDYIHFPTEAFPCSITASSREETCEILVPAITAAKGLSVADAQNLLQDAGGIPEDLACMPGMESGYLILSDHGTSSDATINRFVMSLMPVIEGMIPLVE